MPFLDICENNRLCEPKIVWCQSSHASRMNSRDIAMIAAGSLPAHREIDPAASTTNGYTLASDSNYGLGDASRNHDHSETRARSGSSDVSCGEQSILSSTRLWHALLEFQTERIKKGANFVYSSLQNTHFSHPSNSPCQPISQPPTCTPYPSKTINRTPS